MHTGNNNGFDVQYLLQIGIFFRPYFELKIHFTQLLEHQKAKVKSLEKQVSNVKLSYADTLKNLEQISDEIHKVRRKKLKKRR